MMRDAPPQKDWTPVAEDDAALAVPSLGSLVAGWLLIVPRTHELSFGALDETMLRRVQAFAAPVLRRAASGFGALSLFEHGPAARGAHVGCGIDHAHLHAVPTRGLNLRAAAERHLPQLRWREVSDIRAARAHVEAGESYLFLRDERGRSHLTAGDEIPSQAFRRVIAAELGRPHEFDWRTHGLEQTWSATLAEMARSKVEAAGSTVQH
jgi:diadenosine tetraphosphate (Ap4A) HIT family hydrolase